MGFDKVRCMRRTVEEMAHVDRLEYVFDKVRLQLMDKHGEGKTSKVAWKIGSTTVCLSFWRYSYDVGPAKVVEIRKLVAHGHTRHPDRATRPKLLVNNG